MMKWSYHSNILKDGLQKKAYLREGVALQELGRHGDALAAFASGLAKEPGNTQLLDSLAEAGLNSPLRDKLEPTFLQLDKFGLKSSPFVIIAVIGQELVATGHYSAAVTILEAALKVGTCSLKLRGSVFSALSSALWGLGSLDSAIYHMQQDLAVAKSLGDQEGECRAYGNLGSAYFTKGHYKESLANHRFQLVLAMKLKNRAVAASALGCLGHVYTAIGDYPNALASHKQCVLLLKQSREILGEAREIGNVGAVYLAMGNFDNAVECHQEHLKIARSMKSSVEEARAYSNLGSAHHYKRNYQKATLFHKEVLKIAEANQDKTLEARAYAGLGHASRCAGDTMAAKGYHEKQLDNALQTKDKVAEGRACSNLGIIFHQLEEYEAALKLHKVHLKIAKALHDRASQGRAYGNIGNAYSALGKHEIAVKQHKQELEISSEVNDRHSEGSTHGNLAVAYQALGKTENALHHYLSHLSISRELKDLPSEARALCNLGNFHCARGNHSSAVSFYEQFMSLSKELNDSEGESKACFNLGYVHFNLGNSLEAVRYYEMDLAFARERKDRLALARAYCNLGLAHKSLHQFEDALECQKKCLRLMDALENTPGKLRSLGNIGDLMLKVGDVNEAIKIYQQQLNLAKQCESPDLLATAYGALGSAHRLLGQYDKSLAYHTQELSIRQEVNDLRGECRAHGNVGNVHMSLGNFLTAFKCYQEMLARSKELGDHVLEGQACGNLGITKMNMGQYEDAIGLLEEQLAMLEQHYGPTTLQDKLRAFGNLGDCYEALGDYEEAVKWHEQHLIIAQQTSMLTDQDRAYRGLGNAHKAIGNLQQALVCFEKRLFVAHQTDSSAAKASAYGELGCLHSLLGNLEQAIACLEHQLSLAQEMGDATCQGDAACGLGGVYQQMGEYDTALTYHQMDLKIAEETSNVACQCRAYGNLGLSHESLGNLEEAVHHQEQHLSIAAQMSDGVAKTLAYSSLGRVHHALGHHTQAVQYLQQGLQIAEQLRRKEDEAKIRHRLGVALWAAGDLEKCQQQLHRAVDLFETIRRECQCSSEYRLSLFDLQTACYQTLQRVLVSLNRHEEALVVAERACTRAFIDLLLERQAGSAGLFNGTTMDLTPVSIEQITSTVSNQRSFVLCFSIAAGHLYSWLLTPQQGIVKFHSTRLADFDTDNETVDTQSMVSVSGISLLDQCVGQVRESMGIESHITTTPTGHRSSRLSGHDYSDTDSEADDVFQLQLEEIGDKLNADSDRTGFLAMLNRSHNLNASSYSLGSLFSTSGNSVTGNSSIHSSNFYGGSMRSLGAASTGSGSVRSLTKRLAAKSKTAAGRSPLSKLYQLLIEPMEAIISQLKEEESISGGSGSGSSDSIDLVLVLQGDLYLIPFLMLRREQAESFLFEKYTTIIVPSISALHNANVSDTRGRPIIQSSGALVVSNPRLTSTIRQHWRLQEIPGAEFEARILGELLTCRPLIGAEATKGAVLHQIEQVEVIHFATHISWKLSSIILSPGEFISSPSQHFPVVDSDDSASDIAAMGGPSLSEYLLTAADILNLKLRAKLVVLNSGYTDDRAGRINTDGVVGLTRALLSAGAQCVLFSLWPVPDQASKLLMKTLYTSLLDGVAITKALSLAVKTVQTTAQFSHPSNWGGWVLVGANVTLSSKVALMGHALGQIVEAHSTSRQTLKVLLHLVEKSLQRIQQGCKNSMFTTQQSIENKVGQVAGWKDLLQAVGFRFEPSTGGLPPAVFFPQSDPNERLTQASASLQAFLGLPASSVTAMSKFITNFDVGEALIHVLREILSKLSARESGIDVLVDVRLWRVSGCHEFLASLGLDLVDVGMNNVKLRLSKQAIRRHLQFALQALVSVFDTQEAPRSLQLDTSSSMESLSSNQSAPSSSTFSKSSNTPPLSPHTRGKKSLFNPAEMERARSLQKNSLMMQGSLSARYLESPLSHSSTSEQSTPPASPCPSQSPTLDPALQLSHQAHIRSMYPSRDGQRHTSESAASPHRQDHLSSPVNYRPSLSSTSTVGSDDGRLTKNEIAFDGSGVVGESENGLQKSKGRAACGFGSRSSLRSQSSRSLKSLTSVDSVASTETPQKSVTFAEKLISQEISFDPASPRFESENEDEVSMMQSSQPQNVLPSDIPNTDEVNPTKVIGKENDATDTSPKSASQLRNHFEQLNRQASGSTAPKAGLSQRSTTEGRQISKAQKTSSPLSSVPKMIDALPATSTLDTGAENLALKVLADVANQREAVELMQRQSLRQTQEETRKIMEERERAQKYRPVPAQRKTAVPQTLSLASPSETNMSKSFNLNKGSVNAPLNSNNGFLPNKGSPLVSRANNSSAGINESPPIAPKPRPISKPPGIGMSPQLPQNKMVHHTLSPSPNSRHRMIRTTSAYDALFPKGGTQLPASRLSEQSPTIPSRVPHPHAHHQMSGGTTALGSGENSISSDNSEGAESNLQSSVSSGYHSENSAFVQGRTNIPPPSSGAQDKGVYTQEFVNRTPSFTYSSGSSSPFSRASNDELGPDNNDPGNLSSLSTVFFPAKNQTRTFPNSLNDPRNLLLSGNGNNNNVRKKSPSLPLSHNNIHPQNNMTSVGGVSNVSGNNNISSDTRSSNSGPNSSLMPAVPLVRTNALQSRPDSTNSMSSQYSTSSSTLSTIYRPLGSRDSRDSPHNCDEKLSSPATNSNSAPSAAFTAVGGGNSSFHNNKPTAISTVSTGSTLSSEQHQQNSTRPLSYANYNNRGMSPSYNRNNNNNSNSNKINPNVSSASNSNTGFSYKNTHSLKALDSQVNSVPYNGPHSTNYPNGDQPSPFKSYPGNPSSSSSSSPLPRSSYPHHTTSSIPTIDTGNDFYYQQQRPQGEKRTGSGVDIPMATYGYSHNNENSRTIAPVHSARPEDTWRSSDEGGGRRPAHTDPGKLTQQYGLHSSKC